MAQYLIKVNAIDCPNGNGRPTNVADWDDGWFAVSHRTRRYEGEPPRERDFAIIWVNENSRDRQNGDGLIASASIKAVQTTTQMHAIQIFAPTIFPEPIVTRDVIEQHVQSYGRAGTEHILVRINNDRHRTLYHLSDNDFDELMRPRISRRNDTC
jgi:hypothetical protein